MWELTHIRSRYYLRKLKNINTKKSFDGRDKLNKISFWCKPIYQARWERRQSVEEKEKNYSTPLNKNPKDRHHDNYQDCSQLLPTQAASHRSQGCDNQSSAMSFVYSRWDLYYLNPKIYTSSLQRARLRTESRSQSASFLGSICWHNLSLFQNERRCMLRLAASRLQIHPLMSTLW